MGGLDAQLASLSPRDNAPAQAMDRRGGPGDAQLEAVQRKGGAANKANASTLDRQLQSISTVRKSNHEVTKSSVRNLRRSAAALQRR